MSVLAVLLLLIPFVILSILVTWIAFIRYPNSWKKYIWLFVYGVFVLAYVVEPSYENDVSRYFQIVESLKDLTLNEAITRMGDGLIVENLLFWVIAKTNTVHLLPAITTSIVYGTVCYITCDSAERLGCREKIWIVLFFQVLCLPFFSVVNNVRNVAAFCLIVLAAYRELVQKKRNLTTIALYIAPCFMHKTGVVLVLLRLILILFKRTVWVALAIVFGLPTIINVAYNNISRLPLGGFVGTVLRTLINSAYRYMFNDTTEYAERFRESGLDIVRLTVIVIVIMLGILGYHYFVKCQAEFDDFVVYEILLILLTVATTTITTPAYWRFSIAVYAASGPLLITSLSGIYKRFKLNKNMFYLMGTLALFRFALNLRFSWTRMDFKEFVLGILTTNGYTIIMDIIRNITL